MDYYRQERQMILESVELLTPDALPEFLFRFFKEEASYEDKLGCVERWADYIEWQFPQHCVCLLNEAVGVAVEARDAEAENWFRQRTGLVEGFLHSRTRPPLSCAPQSLIDNRVCVYFGTSGGMGEVYFGRDKREDRICAVKLHTKTGEDHFVEEAASWILMSGHPNIVEAFWSGDHNARQYLLMEYIPGYYGIGPTLRDHLRARELPLTDVLNYSLQFCDGMIWAAAKVPDIVHRDIKPDNILIDHTGTLKISDWGLVAGELPKSSEGGMKLPDGRIYSLRADGASDTFGISETARCGTPAYMSPEQFSHVEVTVRSDIYSFGCTLYEMLARRPPFAGRLRDLASHHLHTAHQPLDQILPAVPTSLSAVVDRCLQKKAESRFEDFAELQKELLEIYRTETGESWASRVAVTPRVRVQVERAIGLSKAGKQEAAYEAIQRIIAAHPDYSLAVFAKGNILKEMSKYEEAIEAYKQALVIEDDQPSIWFNLGLVYFLTDHQSEGRECLENAAKLGHEKAAEALKKFDSKDVGIVLIQ